MTRRQPKRFQSKIEGLPYDVNEIVPRANIELVGQTNNQKEIMDILKIVIRQMETSNKRKRTIEDYTRHVTHFVKVTGVTYTGEVNKATIYFWLDSMKVSPQTKLTRLKALKAFLGKCYKLGYFDNMFWTDIQIRVPRKIKTGAKEHEVLTLLSLLDLNVFVELRDYVAISLMYYNGLRIYTVVQIKESNIDSNNMIIKLDGDILKNHESYVAPISQNLSKLATILIEQNQRIRKHYNQKNDYLFITRTGTPINTRTTNNAIQKRLQNYAKQYGLKNINPHALRRGFARRLLDQGATVFEISKALGHSNLEVTTQYLQMDNQELVERLRKYL